MTILPCGERAVLVELPDLDTVLRTAETITGLRERAGPWTAVTELVPAERTLLISVSDPNALPGVTSALRAVLQSDPSCGAARARPAHVVVVPTRYDGPDLDEVAELTGLTRSEVVAAHTGTPWRVAFTGFTPGFGYLVGGDPRLSLPRRAAPRPEVPPGAVALGGGYCGVYPRRSPGGWYLIGTTGLTLFDESASPPALLTPGTTVQFVAEEL